MQFHVRGTVLAGHEGLDHAIGNLEILGANDGSVWVLASSGANGGLAAWCLSEGSTSLVDTAFFNPAWALGIGAGFALADDGAGGLVALFGSTGSSTLGAWSVSAEGEIGTLRHLSGLATGFGAPDAMAVYDGQLLISGEASGFRTYDFPGNALGPGAVVTDTSYSLVAGASEFATADFGASTVVLVGSATEFGLTSYLDNGSGLVLAGRSGPVEGAGLMRITGITTAQIGEETFAIVASSEGNAGALSVFRVASDGSLLLVDHLLDTRFTRFGGTQAVATATHDGVTWVVAGGNDDGLSLFVLMPDGRLQYTDSIADSTTTGLQNISALVATMVGDSLRVLASSQREAGLTELDVDLSNQGIAHSAVAAGEIFSGTAGDDTLFGGAGVDRIDAGAGDDILRDGAGRDVISGGAGADIFVMSMDESEDIILDFDPTQDRLDLSNWLMFRDPMSLTIAPTAAGAEIRWSGVKLVLRSAAGGSMSADSVRAAVLAGPDRLPDLGGIIVPDDAQWDITGTNFNDELHGGLNHEAINSGIGADLVYGNGGNDVITTGVAIGTRVLGSGTSASTPIAAATAPDLLGDTIFGGYGNDTIKAASSNDQVYGGVGNDVMASQAGNDWVVGGEGADKTWLGDGADRYTDALEIGTGWSDTVLGGNGNDFIATGAGNDLASGEADNDSLYGGTGNDRVYGGAGQDLLMGENGDDRLFGDAGNDTLNGGSGIDILSGGSGYDALDGGIGNDRLFGGTEADTLQGGAGNDVLYGEAGNDSLLGADGDDQLRGGLDNDFLDGGIGNDVLLGETGNDFMLGGAGNDILYASEGNDVLSGQQGNDNLYGGSGADRFVFSASLVGDHDAIRDFEVRTDRISLYGADASDVRFTSLGVGLRLSWGSGDVVLFGVTNAAAVLGQIDYL